DIDSKGVVWVSLGSGHLGSFDRRKCKGPLNGPQATGDQCAEGWSFHQYPGPGFAGICDNSAEASYYTPEALLRVGLSPAAKVLDLQGRLRCSGVREKGAGSRFDQVGGQACERFGPHPRTSRNDR